MPRYSSQSCGDSLQVICLSGQDGAIYRLPKHSQRSDWLKKEDLAKADCWLLAVVQTRTVSLLLYPVSGSEKRSLKLCVNNAHFDESGHKI